MTPWNPGSEDGESSSTPARYSRSTDTYCLDSLEPGQRRRRVLMTKGVYQVEAIPEKRVTNGETMFKIKWKGFDD